MTAKPERQRQPFVVIQRLLRRSSGASMRVHGVKELAAPKKELVACQQWVDNGVFPS